MKKKSKPNFLLYLREYRLCLCWTCPYIHMLGITFVHCKQYQPILTYSYSHKREIFTTFSFPEKLCIYITLHIYFFGWYVLYNLGPRNAFTSCDKKSQYHIRNNSEPFLNVNPWQYDATSSIYSVSYLLSVK